MSKATEVCALVFAKHFVQLLYEVMGMTIRMSVVAVLLAAVLTLPACTHKNTTPPAPPNISGDYTGTAQDSVNGALAATAILAQHGGSAGGTLTTSVPGGATLTSAISLVISSSNALSGTIVEDLPGGVTCTFSTTGSYNTTSQQITGSYSAVTGCSGQSGTYTLNQVCTDTVTTAAGRRRMGVPKC